MQFTLLEALFGKLGTPFFGLTIATDTLSEICVRKVLTCNPCYEYLWGSCKLHILPHQLHGKYDSNCILVADTTKGVSVWVNVKVTLLCLE